MTNSNCIVLVIAIQFKIWYTYFCAGIGQAWDFTPGGSAALQKTNIIYV